MPGEVIAELAGGFLRAVGRVLAEILLHIVGEVAIQGMGYLICRPFKPSIKADGVLATVIGLAFWVFVGVVVYLAFELFSGVGGLPSQAG